MKSFFQTICIFAFFSLTETAFSVDPMDQVAIVLNQYQRGLIGKRDLEMFLDGELRRTFQRQELMLKAEMALSNRMVYERIEKQKREEMKPVLEERTVLFLKQRATNGSPDAAFEMFERYRDGKGVNQDNDESFKYLRLSALNGNEKAKTILNSGAWKKGDTNLINQTMK